MVPRVLYYQPLYGPIDPAPYFAQLHLQRHMMRAEIEGRYTVRLVVDGPRTPIRDARNAACKLARHFETTHLFMVDNDMAPAENLLDTLLAAAKPIVGALCFKETGEACSWISDGHGGELYDAEPPRTGLHERVAVGSGAMLIETAVLAKLKEPWFFFDESSRSMDMNFCRRARAEGFSVWCSSDGFTQQRSHKERMTPTPW